MAGEWRSASLDELVDDIVDRRGVTPLKLGSSFVESGYRVISAKAIKDRRVDLLADEPRFVDEVTYRKWMKTPLLADDVILTSEAPLGEAAYVREPVEWCLGQRLFGIRTKKTRLHGRFLFYALQSEEVRHDLLSRATGTTAQGIRQSELRRVRIPLPDVGEQRVIAHILGTLDDKIELNRRMNETLEAIARGLFKSWFVDFDPVCAKAEGRDPGLPKHLADLFPDGFDQSELGQIPRGWRVATVHELAEINAWTLSAADSLDVIDYIEISEVMRGAIGNVPRYHRGTEPSRARRRLRHGDSVVSTVRPDRGAHFLCLNPAETLIASTGFAVLSPRDVNWALLYCALTRPDVGEEFGRLADGGAYPAIRPEAIASLTLAMPPGADLPSSFQKLAAPLFDRTHQNRSEAKTLAALRDTLLPRLISGDLRVEDAERFMAEHAS